MLSVSDLVTMQRRSSAEPDTILCERDLWRPRLKIDHRHDDIALAEPLTIVAELVVRREFSGAAVAPRVDFLAYQTRKSAQ